MHGITKEIHRLAKASAMLEAAPGGWSGSASETVYRELLAELAEHHPQKVRTRVVVDVVAGTSAGGINGVYLAKGLAHNRSQDSLRDLWFERGDIDQLLNAPRRLPRWLRLIWVALGALWRSPLRGDGMSRWLYDALAGMDDGGSTPAEVTTLMPEGHLLELFVTVTDFYGYDRQVPIYQPPLVHDSRHRHVLGFSYEEGLQDDLSERGNGGLAFAARTTSCFPGVFPPVSLAGFARYLEGRNADLSGLERRFFRLYELAGAQPRDTWFVDGGVLDNKPFGHAIEAIRQRPADLEVDRRLLYLEPSPGTPEPPSRHPAPGTVSALLGAVSGIPRAEPILDDLLEVASLNERVQRIGDIVETSFERIRELVEQTIGDELDAAPDPQSPRLGEWAQELNRAAVDKAGFSHATYIRLKISGVVDRYARAVCNACEFPPDSNHAMLVRTVLRCWAEEAGLFERLAQPSEQQTEFLRSFDLGYGERRLRFVIAGLIGWYAARVGTRLSGPRRAGRREGNPVPGDRDAEGGDVGQRLRRGAGRFDPALLRRRDARRLPARARAGRAALRRREPDRAGQALDDASRVARGEALGLHADALPRPLRADAALGSRAATRPARPVPRLSLLGRPPLSGPGLERRGRTRSGRGGQDEPAGRAAAASAERRAQGEGRRRSTISARSSAAPTARTTTSGGGSTRAERLIGILVGSETDPTYEPWCRKAFAAVLDEEEEAVPHSRALVAHLRSQLQAART